MKYNINNNQKDSEFKMNKQDYKLENPTTMVKNIMDGIQISNSSPYKEDSPKA